MRETQGRDFDLVPYPLERNSADFTGRCIKQIKDCSDCNSFCLSHLTVTLLSLRSCHYSEMRKRQGASKTAAKYGNVVLNSEELSGSGPSERAQWQLLQTAAAGLGVTLLYICTSTANSAPCPFVPAASCPSGFVSTCSEEDFSKLSNSLSFSKLKSGNV